MASFGAPPHDELLKVYRPSKPLVAHTKDGKSFHVSREVALKQFEYIQTDPPCIRSLVIVDRDLPDSDFITDELGLPVPTWTACNPGKGSGHICYALARPVCMTDAARRKPVNLLARVEAGMRDVLGGDVSYTGQRTKNPANAAHNTVMLWIDEIPQYGLLDLSSALSDLGALPRWDNHKAVISTEVGRNCGLFEMTRKWAYKARIKLGFPPLPEWTVEVENQALTYNISQIGEMYSMGPLHPAEVHHLARSIATWTFKRFTPERAALIDRRRKIKGGQARAQQKLGGRTRDELANKLEQL